MDTGRDLTGTRAQAIRDFRREQVLTAARSLFVDRGTVDVAVAEIAAAAGVSRSTLYNYFATRDDVLQACVVASHERLLASTKAAVAAGADPIESLIGFFEAPLREIDDSQGFFRITQALLSGSSPAARGTSVEMSLLAMGLSATLMPILEAGVASGAFMIEDLEAGREFVFAVLNGAILRRSFGHNRPPRETAERLTRLVVTGLSGNAAESDDREQR
jgi:AcrR family transcriptional regulator